MATELLNQRIRQIMCARIRNGYSDPTPTLIDIEKTHILFVNAHFKPLDSLMVIVRYPNKSQTKSTVNNCKTNDYYNRVLQLASQIIRIRDERIGRDRQDNWQDNLVRGKLNLMYKFKHANLVGTIMYKIWSTCNARKGVAFIDLMNVKERAKPIRKNECNWNPHQIKVTFTVEIHEQIHELISKDNGRYKLCSTCSTNSIRGQG
jgi:hypothetical protein